MQQQQSRSERARANVDRSIDDLLVRSIVVDRPGRLTPAAATTKRQPQQDSNSAPWQAGCPGLGLSRSSKTDDDDDDGDMTIMTMTMTMIRADQTRLPLLIPLLSRQLNHTHYNTILLSIIIILLSITLLFVHTQACGNRIPIVGFVVCLFVCGVCV